MFEDRSGRLANTIDEASEYLWKFIAENITVTDPRIKQHSYDYDLYLPWLLQIFDRHGEQHGEKLSLVELQGLYMDAAWDLVMKGFLRPGTRTIDGDQAKDAYGNGYALTGKGKQKVVHVPVPSEDERQRPMATSSAH